MAGYLGSVPVPQATQHRESFTCTEGQTSFATAGYIAQFVDVYLNGSHLSPADFTATNGSDVVLAVAASADDVCDIISYTPFEVANQTFTGNTIMTNGDNTAQLTLTSTDADANAGPKLKLRRNSASPADDDLIGALDWTSENSDGDEHEFLNLTARMRDVTAGSEDVAYAWTAYLNGTGREIQSFVNTAASAASMVFNEDSQDIDFRVESNGDENMLFVDGGNNRVGVGTNAPVGTLVVEATVPKIQATTGSKHLEFGVGGSGCGLVMTDGHFMTFNHQPFANRGTDTNLTERMRITNVGDVGINVTAPAATLHVHDTTAAANVLQLSTAATGSGGSDGFVVGMSASDVYIFNRENTPVRFGTNNTERMRIDSSGTMLVQTGGAAPSASQEGVSIGLSGPDGGQISIANTLTSTFAGAIVFINGNGQVGSIQTSGSATSYITSSDYRLKENVDYTWDATTRLKQLKPARFNFIADADTVVDGFLAHEAQLVVPESVTGTKDAMRDEEYEVSAAVEEVTDDDGNVTTEAADAVMGTRSVPDMQGIDQSKLVPLLVKTIQELEARITALEG